MSEVKEQREWRSAKVVWSQPGTPDEYITIQLSDDHGMNRFVVRHVGERPGPGAEGWFDGISWRPSLGPETIPPREIGEVEPVALDREPPATKAGGWVLLPDAGRLRPRLYRSREAALNAARRRIEAGEGYVYVARLTHSFESVTSVAVTELPPRHDAEEEEDEA